MKNNNIKIVFMVGGPMTDRWNDYYHIDELTSCFDVEFWNFYNLIENGYNVSNYLKRDYVANLLDINDLKSNLKRLPKDSLFVIELGFIEKYYKILKIVSKYNSFCIVIDFWTYYLWDAVKNNDNTNKIETKITSNDEHFLLSNLVRTIKNVECFRFLRELLHCNRYGELKSIIDRHKLRKKEQYSFLIEHKCNQLFKKIYITYRPHQKYTINHPDYDKYLKIKDSTNRMDRYIVFIGDFYPYHPEIIIDCEVDKNVVSSQYYSSLNKFFNVVERLYNCNVVIAEHPSANWKQNPFNGREVVYFKTAELVRDSIGVCLHASCAFSFVALFNKPVAIIIADALKYNHSMRNDIFKMANSLGVMPINIDDCNNNVSEVFRPIPNDIRLKYISTFADADNNLTNEELFKKYYVAIYNEMYNVSK